MKLKKEFVVVSDGMPDSGACGKLPVCVYSIHVTVYLTACASQYAKYIFDIQYHERNNMQIIIDYYYY